MTLETEIFTALKSLVNNRVYIHPAPQTVSELPRITYQQIGGVPINFLEGSPVPKDRCRVQVNCWYGNREQDKEAALALGRAAANALRAHTELQTTVLSGMIFVFDQETALSGTMQDFQVFG